MPFEYAAVSMADLILKLGSLTAAKESGSLTRVGVSSGIAHEFNAMSPDQVDAQLRRVALALHLKWLDLNSTADPNDNPYPDPMIGRILNVTQVF